MADSFDRYDNEGSGGGGFMMGLLTGTVLGAGLGMLLAPKAGAELRGALGEQARTWGNAASEQYKKASEVASEQYKKASETAGTWAERGRDMVDKAREAVGRGADEARSYASGTTGSSYSSGNSGSSFGSGSTGGNSGTTDFGRS